MNSRKEIKFGIVLQYVQMGLNILIHLVYTPAMIGILGKNEYGIYSLASSVISYLSLLSLGFGASYIRFYTRYKNNKDSDAVSSLNGLYLMVFSIIGIISLVSGLFISNNVRLFFNESYRTEEIELAKKLMIFLAINLAISFPASVFVSYISSQEKFIYQKLMNMGKTIISPCLSIALLFHGYGAIGMVVATTIISLVVDGVNIFYCIVKLNMRFSIKPNKELLNEIAKFSLFIAINQIIDQLNWQTDKLVLGKIINASAVSIYSIGATLNTMYISFSTAIASVFTPKVHRIVEEKENVDEKLTDLFIKIGRLQFYVLMLILSGFIFWGKYFIYKWVGPGFDDAYDVALLLMCPITISLIQNLGVEIQRAKNQHQFRSIVYLIMAILNIAVSIQLCKIYGIVGVALGTTISLLFANGLVMNYYYFAKLGINIIRFWKSILSIFPAFVLPCLFGILVSNKYSFKGYFDFGFILIVYSGLYSVSIFLFAFNKEEKEMLRTMLPASVKAKKLNVRKKY